MRATKGRPYDSSSIVWERRNFCFAEIRRPDFGTLPFVRLQKTCVISPYISRHYDTRLVRYTIEVNQTSERCSPLHYVDTKKDSTLEKCCPFSIFIWVYLSIFQNSTEYGLSSLPPPKSWIVPVRSSSA